MCHERTERSHTPGATLHGSGDVVPHRNENGVPQSVARHEAVEYTSQFLVMKLGLRMTTPTQAPRRPSSICRRLRQRRPTPTQVSRVAKARIRYVRLPYSAGARTSLAEFRSSTIPALPVALDGAARAVVYRTANATLFVAAFSGRHLRDLPTMSRVATWSP
jgi:hypothetical protein